MTYIGKGRPVGESPAARSVTKNSTRIYVWGTYIVTTVIYYDRRSIYYRMKSMYAESMRIDGYRRRAE